MIKRLLKISGIILALIILPNYIPIKFAKNINNIKSLNNGYVCNYVTATDGNWITYIETNDSIKEEICLNIDNDTSFNKLKEIYNVRYGEPVCNTYIFYGQVYKRKAGENFEIYGIELDDWDIVYPIKRNSIRELFTPSQYLTIYDFIWRSK